MYILYMCEYLLNLCYKKKTRKKHAEIVSRNVVFREATIVSRID